MNTITVNPSSTQSNENCLKYNLSSSSASSSSSSSPSSSSQSSSSSSSTHIPLNNIYNTHNHVYPNIYGHQSSSQQMSSTQNFSFNNNNNTNMGYYDGSQQQQQQQHQTDLYDYTTANLNNYNHAHYNTNESSQMQSADFLDNNPSAMPTTTASTTTTTSTTTSTGLNQSDKIIQSEYSSNLFGNDSFRLKKLRTSTATTTTTNTTGTTSTSTAATTNKSDSDRNVLSSPINCQSSPQSSTSPVSTSDPTNLKHESNSFGNDDYTSNAYVQHHNHPQHHHHHHQNQHPINRQNYLTTSTSHYNRNTGQFLDNGLSLAHNNYDYTSQAYYSNHVANQVSTQNLYAAICANGGTYGQVSDLYTNVQQQQQLHHHQHHQQQHQRNEEYLATYPFLNGNSTSPHSNSSSTYNTCSSPLQTTTLTTTTSSSMTGPLSYIQQTHYNQSVPSTSSISSGYSSGPTSGSSISIDNGSTPLMGPTHRNRSDLLYNTSFKSNSMSFDVNHQQAKYKSQQPTGHNNYGSRINSNASASSSSSTGHSTTLPIIPVVSSLNVQSMSALSQDIPPNQLCAVCGDNAACQHYGVRTCEGCKGFFKRTVQKNSKYVCLAEKNCPVDKRRRNRCQYCRFQKCLAVGMVKEVVRTNDLKGRRGRLPTKPKSPNMQTNRSQQSALLAQITRVYTDTVPTQTAFDFSKYRKITKETVRMEEEPYWVLQSLVKSCDIVKQWADKFSSLARIPNNDRDRMLFSNLLDLVILRMALKMQENIERIVLCDAVVFHKTQMAYVLTPSILQHIQDLSNKLKQPDPTIASLLVALVFLQDPQQVTMNDLYCKLRDILKDQSNSQQNSQMQNNNYPSSMPNYYLHLTELFAQIHQIKIAVKQRLKQCSFYNNSIYPSNSILDLYLQSEDNTQLGILTQQHLNQNDIKHEILMHEFS